MAVSLTLKQSAPGQLHYDWMSDTAGDLAVARTRDQLIADCTRRDQFGLKSMFETAQTPEQWAALPIDTVAVPAGMNRIALTPSWTVVDGVLQLVISGKSRGLSLASINVRLKRK